MERVLRDGDQLKKAQQDDLRLKPIRDNLERGEGEQADYILDDQGLLWFAPRGAAHVVALPRKLVSAVLALAHGTFGHSGIARTTIIVADKYH